MTSQFRASSPQLLAREGAGHVPTLAGAAFHIGCAAVHSSMSAIQPTKQTPPKTSSTATSGFSQ